MQSLDDSLFAILNRGVANPLLDAVMPSVTSLHQQKLFMGVLLLALLAIVVKGDRRARVWVLCLIVAVGTSDLVSVRLVKRVTDRLRPCHSSVPGGPTAFPDVRLVPGQHCPGSQSFPSSHASNMMALAGVCWWFERRRRPTAAAAGNGGEPVAAPRRYAPLLWFLLPLVIGYSRIYLGYHYPSDVAGGWLLGALIAVAVVTLLARRLLPASSASAPEGPVSDPI